MKIIATYIAQGDPGTPEPVTIVINEPLPDFEQRGQWDQAAAMFAEASRLDSYLANALPRALYEQLLAQMLTRRASNLLVPFAQVNIKEQEHNAAYWRKEFNDLQELFDRYIRRTEAIELELCGDNIREGGADIWEHISAHARSIHAPRFKNDTDHLADMDRLAYLEAERKALATRVEEVIGTGGGEVQITIHAESPTIEARLLAAAESLGFEEYGDLIARYFFTSPVSGQIILITAPEKTTPEGDDHERKP